MKTLLVAGTLLVCSLVLFTSCQKEADWDLASPQTNDSLYIRKYIVIDTTLTPGADTVRIFDFQYNAQKRLSGFIHTVYEPGVPGPGRIRGSYTYAYTYNGSDTLPGKITEDFNDILIPANNYKDTVYYFYQGGTVVKDSSGDATEYFVDEIIKLSSTRTLLRQRNLVPPFGLSIDTTFIFTNWQNGNLLQQKDSLWLPLMGFYDISDYTAQYDTKPNPFKRMLLPYSIPFNKDIYGFSLEGIAPPTVNNIIFFDGDAGSLTTRYQYRADGLPVFSWDDDGAKCIYQYTLL